jgi:hypothetical protein
MTEKTVVITRACEGADTWYGVLGALFPGMCLKSPARLERAKRRRHVGFTARSRRLEICPDSSLACARPMRSSICSTSVAPSRDGRSRRFPPR